jgi:hypothetical protein
MGGYGSGRSGGWPTVEDSLSLNLRRLFKTGWLKQGAWVSGILRWSIASMGFEARLSEEEGDVRLHWTSTNRWSGERRQCENRIELTTRVQPLGGRRWWFVCPRTGQLAERLHLPSGADTFACRKAYRLAYRSQRETACDRAISRAFSLRSRAARSALNFQSSTRSATHRTHYRQSSPPRPAARFSATRPRPWPASSVHLSKPSS